MGPNQGRKARVIAKIKGFTDLEPEASEKWISVHRGDDSGTLTVSFGDELTSRKESYELDYIYDRSEGNDLIFPREVKPLVEDVFNGCNATVIAYGARGSGKTFTIQGSEVKPGLAVLAMAEILSMAKGSGKLISISCYEILKDHAYDLLDPNRHEVLVWEDVARGKIQLKGLSQAKFQKLYFLSKNSHKHLSSQNSHKQSEKMIAEPNQRSHKGLIIHVFRGNQSDALPLGKMNFVDLSGYEDVRKKGTGGVNLQESNIINKSIYALHNVVYALNANESHVPYRESKITRMLRDSLGGTNKILMITCLNSSYCQDSLYMIKLASRSSKGANKIILDSTKKTKSIVKPTLLSSSSKTASAIAAKQTGTRSGFLVNKANVNASIIKGRKLFDEGISTKSKKASHEESLPLEIVSTVTEHAKHEEEKKSSGISEAVGSLTEDHFPLISCSAEESDMPVKASTQETKLLDKVNVTDENNHDKSTPKIGSKAEAASFVGADPAMDKENTLALVDKDESPPISARLQELSKNLKLLYSSTPSCADILSKTDIPTNSRVSTEILEPETPRTPEPRLLDNDKSDIAVNSCSSWKAFSARSSRMKNTLVDEYLRFLNTASK
ncbi:ATP binding microtubule motor family protein, putative isoform 2 [Hibiscus syriacus]|uniref:ATP binding microtubule motor family protein, putative isoform 2 n=1 Tax=Hibiscus syriacus TaxID=106335 RepID=A0A6A3D3F8_HIBSY|nr:ATP binding microtubule motor family protein, putative isoform 2 [Hibiscus syriacus]